jgi:hypothetical protein
MEGEMPEAEKAEIAEPKPEVAEQPEVEEKEIGKDGKEYDPIRAQATIEKLRLQLKDVEKRAKKADELEAAEAKRKEAEMSDLEKAQKKTAELESELKSTKLAILRRDVAERVGLPATFVDRLKGETPEDLEADAKALLDAFPKSDKQAPKIAATNPGGAAVGETETQALARIHGRDTNIFGMAKQGGGTYINEK